MTIKHWPPLERPREKLLKHGAHTLSDAELLAIFLHTGTRGKTAVDLARDLLNAHDSLNNLLDMPCKEFCNLYGVGPAKYALLQAALEIGHRLLKDTLMTQNVLTNSSTTRQYLIGQLRGMPHEVFACLFLDNQHRLISYEELFYGSIDNTTVYPREVVKRALEHNAAAAIFAHNHPSGAPGKRIGIMQLRNCLIMEFING